jgi:DNA primase
MSDQSVAGWMTMEIGMKKAAQRVSEEGIWTAASLAAVPIPEFFNCCSLSQNETKLRVDHKYAIQQSDRRKDRSRYDIRKSNESLHSQKGHTNEYQTQREGYRGPGLVPSAELGPRYLGANAKPEPRIKPVGKCLSAADARKLLQEMGVEEDAQLEFNGLGGQQRILHSSSKSIQNPRVLVRYSLQHHILLQNIPSS